MHLFWRYGFYQTSVEELVHYLGINRASLYDTYGDKEGLFTRCFETYKKEQIVMEMEWVIHVIIVYLLQTRTN